MIFSPNQIQQTTAILSASKRKGHVPFRNAFAQSGHGADSVPGPLHQIVRLGREKTLDQYMIALAWASGGEFDVTEDSRIWARAIGAKDDEAGRRMVSRNWRFLSDLKLVSVTRKNRKASVTILREDGSGESYSRPGEAGDDYIQIPFAYWKDGYVEKLNLPGKALLFISMTQPDFFRLPADRGPAWYGISPSTVERGFRELRQAGLIEAPTAYRLAPLTPEGFTNDNYYRLRAPFGPRGRRARNLPDEIIKYADLPKPTNSAAIQPEDHDGKEGEQPIQAAAD